MSIGWSANAKTAILAGCPIRWTFHVDVEQDGEGTYGVKIIDITDYVLRPWPVIERSSSAIDKDWKTKPVTLKVRNDNNYFTPNLCGVAKDQLSNIWQERPSGQANYRECRVYIKLTVTLADKSTETKMFFRGKIVDLNFMIDKREIVTEIIARDDFLDALDVVLESDEGGEDSYIMSV